MVAGLTALCAGCGSRRPPAPEPLSGPVVLGWRLVTGSEHTWRTVVRHQVGPHQVSRAEAWTYRVRELDSSGTALLQGRLTGFGAGRVDADGNLVPGTEAELLAEQERLGPVALRLTSYGEIQDLTTARFADGLVHRMLGLRLPSWAVTTGDEWPAPGLAQWFGRLLEGQAPVEATAICKLTSVEHELAPLIRLQSLGEARVPEGPRVVFEDTTRFNAERGLLQEREVTARLDGPAPTGLPTGALSLSLTRVSL